MKISYNMDEAARALGCSKRKVYDLVSRGELTTFKFAGRTLIRADVLQRAIDRASGGKAA
ncbi:helix-turn-helix domain-containing protein [Phenylobacterium sp.]|uniref:helix-turn-helix domain-containing protein n=1 Tax=Phenylobacterium sp. TaxID=1871053 RepID=UPI00392B8681